MNRRDYFKSALAIFGFTLFSSPAVRLFSFNKLDGRELLKRKALIADLSELIIPAGETPGAKMASVEEYIIRVMLDCRETKQQRKFLNGLMDLENYTLNVYEMDFIHCSRAIQYKVLKHFFEEETFSQSLMNKIRKKILGKSFMLELRDLSIEGYCQSLLGATFGLRYDYVPGNYQPCIISDPHQRSWATK